MMKRASIALAVVLATAAVPLQAQTGFYVGAQVTGASLSYKDAAEKLDFGCPERLAGAALGDGGRPAVTPARAILRPGGADGGAVRESGGGGVWESGGGRGCGGEIRSSDEVVKRTDTSNRQFPVGRSGADADITVRIDSKH